MVSEYVKISHQPANDKSDKNDHRQIADPARNRDRCFRTIMGESHSGDQWNEQYENHVDQQFRETNVH